MSTFDENVIPGAEVAGTTTQQTTVYGTATAADEQTAIDLAITAARQNAYDKFGVSTGVTLDNTTDSIRIKQNTILLKNGKEDYTYTVQYGATAYLNTPVPNNVTTEENKVADDPPPVVQDNPTESVEIPELIDNKPPEPPPPPAPVTQPVVANTSPAIMPTVVVTANKTTAQKSLPNPLHDYDSYTYCLSWHLMNIFDFNKVVDDPQRRYIPKNVLISSAGRFQGLARSPYFTEDFYFDNLKMTTIIGAGKRNKSSNVIEVNFTIIEPLGFTLFNKIVKAAELVNGANGNYMKMPYMLQIDFFGIKNGDIGETPISNLTKHIPITIIGIKTKVSARGVEYSVNAVAFNHSAFNNVFVRSPADFNIRASKVVEVFGSGDTDSTSDDVLKAAQEKADLERQESDLIKDFGADVIGGQEGADLRAAQNTLKSKIASVGPFKISGFTDGINAFNKDLKRRGSINRVSTVKVVFDPEIGNSEIYPTDSPVSASAAASTDNNTVKDQKAAIQANLTNKGKIKFDSGQITIPAGTSITDLIDWAIRNSKWMERQLYDPTADSDKKSQTGNQLKDPLQWVKIIPKIKFSKEGYDPSTSYYSLDITYYVKPWRVNSKLPTGPLGKTPGYVKEYNYIYTGQNSDILDMQIDFDMLYYQQMTANRNKRKTTMTAPAAGDPEVYYENNGESSSTSGPVSDVQKSGPIVIPQSKVQPIPVAYTSNDIRYMNRQGGNQAASVTGSDLQKNLFKGDMISVKLKIVGDPHFIKQDDVFFGQDEITPSGLLTRNNSLWMDNSELYVYVRFKSPMDYDESLGLAIPSGQSYSESELSGVYRIITVDNEFRGGVFTQVLDLARLPLSQEMEFIRTNAQQRSDSAMIIQMGQKGAFQASRFSGPSILQNALKTAGVSGPAAALAQTAATNPSALEGIASSALNKALKTAGDKFMEQIGTPFVDTLKGVASDIQASVTEYIGGLEINSMMPDVTSDLPEDFDPDYAAPDVAEVEDVPVETPEDIGDFFG